MEGMQLIGRVLQGTSDSQSRSQGALEGKRNHFEECIDREVRACHWGLLSPRRLPVTSKHKPICGPCRRQVDAAAARPYCS